MATITMIAMTIITIMIATTIIITMFTKRHIFADVTMTTRLIKAISVTNSIGSTLATWSQNSH